MKIDSFLKIINADFFTGVPDSLLKSLCDYLIDRYGDNCKHHIIAANEGNSVAIAAGYHLATGKVPVVYMQNSGEGNAINPIASLLNEKVYGIPAIFIIGWRGEPDVYDEPQHVFQGEITLKLLENMDIEFCVVDQKFTECEMISIMEKYKGLLEEGRQVAFVIKKGALEYDKKLQYRNNYYLKREKIIESIVSVAKEDCIISTTGKTSRELFEIREANKEDHKRDFLTVGSMGHSSSIALGIALQKPNEKIWIIDGDGSVLMHMGAMAVLGACQPKNVVHIIINNEAHESVGGQPTVMNSINLVDIALGCGYKTAVCVEDLNDLRNALNKAKYTDELSCIEVKCAIGARADLGRPTTTAKENKKVFMTYITKGL